MSTERCRVAVVSGAAGDIGAAIVERLWADGMEVLALDRDAERLLRGGEQPRARHTNLVVDLAEPAGIQMASDWIASRDQGVDVLVNAAAISSGSRLHELDAAEWDEVIGVNLSAVVHLTRAIVTAMIPRRRGCIINVASVDGLARNNNVAYAVTKAGLLRLSTAVARTYGKYGIRSNTVVPGFIESHMLRQYFTAEHRQALAASIPLRRVGRPDEVATVVSAMASESFAYVTGAAVTVDGGYLT